MQYSRANSNELTEYCTLWILYTRWSMLKKYTKMWFYQISNIGFQKVAFFLVSIPEQRPHRTIKQFVSFGTLSIGSSDLLLEELKLTPRHHAYLSSIIYTISRLTQTKFTRQKVNTLLLGFYIFVIKCAITFAQWSMKIIVFFYQNVTGICP